MTQDMKTEAPTTGDATVTSMTDLEKGARNNREKKHNNVRTGDKSNEQIIIPKNRIVVVFIGLMLTVFLAALDQTIVCIFPPLPPASN